MAKGRFVGPRNDADEDEDAILGDLLNPKKKHYHFYEQTFTAQQLHFYLSSEIVEADQYVDMIHKMQTASSGDVIFLHLNLNGGQLDTGVQIINAMQTSQAKVVTVLESLAHSLGTLIFLAGDEMVVHDHCMMMFHNFRSGLVGKGQELAAELDATIKWFTLLAKKFYIPFLSPEEFDRLLRGEDLWMQAPEIRKRLERVINPPPQEKAPRKKAVKK